MVEFGFLRRGKMTFWTNTQILRSGFDISQTPHILISGIRAFNGRVLRAWQSGRHLHRCAESSLGERLKKKILGKLVDTKERENPTKTLLKIKKKNPKLSCCSLFPGQVNLSWPRCPERRSSSWLRSPTTGSKSRRWMALSFAGSYVRKIPCSRPLCMVCKGGPDR